MTAVERHDAATVDLAGAIIIEPPVIDSVEAWCEWYAVEPVEHPAGPCLPLYKALDDDWSTDRGREAGIGYEPGTSEVVSPDWDPDPDRECGGGLHVSPSPSAASWFNPGAERWVRILVPIADIRAPQPSDAHRDKLRARRVLDVIAVDIDGEPVTQPAEVAA